MPDTLKTILACGRVQRITYYPSLLSPYHDIRTSMLRAISLHEPSHPQLAKLRKHLTSDLFESIVLKDASTQLSQAPSPQTPSDPTYLRQIIVTAIARELQRSALTHLSRLLASLSKKTQ